MTFGLERKRHLEVLETGAGGGVSGFEPLSESSVGLAHFCVRSAYPGVLIPEVRLGWGP